MRVCFWIWYLSILGNKKEPDFCCVNVCVFFSVLSFYVVSFWLSSAVREVKIAREAEVAVHEIAADFQLNLCACYFLLHRHFLRAGASKWEMLRTWSLEICRQAESAFSFVRMSWLLELSYCDLQWFLTELDLENQRGRAAWFLSLSILVVQ